MHFSWSGSFVSCVVQLHCTYYLDGLAQADAEELLCYSKLIIFFRFVCIRSWLSKLLWSHESTYHYYSFLHGWKLEKQFAYNLVNQKDIKFRLREDEHHAVVLASRKKKSLTCNEIYCEGFFYVLILTNHMGTKENDITFCLLYKRFCR